MANYTLLVITFNREADRALRADNRFGATLNHIVNDAKTIPGIFNDDPTHADEAGVVADLKAGDTTIGTVRGMFYDARVVKTQLMPGELACVIRHDVVDNAWGETGKKVARALRDFKKAAPDKRWMIATSSDAFWPIYWNNTTAPQMVEVHKVHARVEGDQNTRWVFDPRTTYISLVHN